MARVDDRERTEQRLQALQREHARGWKAVVVRRLLLSLVLGVMLLAFLIVFLRLSHGVLTPTDFEKIDRYIFFVLVFATLGSIASWPSLNEQIRRFQSRLAEIDRRNAQLGNPQ